MTQIISDNILAFGYLALWVLTFCWYHHIKKQIDAGTAIIGMYIIYAFFSILIINDNLFSIAFDQLHVLPYIYLYLMMMIALSPIIVNHTNSVNKIENPNSQILSFIGWSIFICSILMLPGMISNSSNGITDIIIDSSAGKEAYSEQTEAVAASGSKINNLFAIVYNTLSDLPAFILFYSLTQKKQNPYLTLALIITLIIGLYTPLSTGQRGGAISCILTILGAYMLFRQYISKKINRIILLTGITGILIVSIPVIAITKSRFNTEQGGATGFVNWYIGQGSLYFNNYGLDNGGIRHGDRTMNMFKRIIDPDTPKNYVERRDKNRYLKIDDNFFTTFVGDFTLDFGPFVPIFIFICFNGTIILLTRPKGNKLKLYQVLILYLTVCINLQGGMTLYSYSDLGSMRLITFVMLYSYLRYHEALLKKYPYTVSKNEKNI